MVGSGYASLLLIGCGCAVSRQTLSDAVQLEQADTRPMVRRDGSRGNVAVPGWAALDRAEVSSRGTLTLSFRSPAPAQGQGSGWAEVFLGDVDRTGKWTREPTCAVYLHLSGRPEDSRMAAFTKPGDAFVWNLAGKLRRAPVRSSGSDYVLDLSRAEVRSAKICAASSHWYPDLGKQWREPRDWQTAVARFERPHEARMWFELSFAGLAGDLMKELKRHE